MRILILCVSVILLAAHEAHAADRPVVLELFTSQGCSSCPPADELLKKLSGDSNVLALSFHVHYWDYLGWKDPFSSEDNTNRQRAYARLLDESVYTPEMVVDGAYPMVGSDESAVKSAIDSARKNMSNIPIKLTRNKDSLSIDVTSKQTSHPAGMLWAVQFKKHSVTSVQAGENSGRTLENVNNVTRLTELGIWDKDKNHFEMPIKDIGEDGIAILLQQETPPRIIGAATL